MRQLVLVHGAWHGEWCWSKVVEALGDEGIAAHTVELPFDGHAGDVDALRRVLDDIAGDKVVVGHSYGGMVISDAAGGRDDVVHLVYLCALMLAIGDDPVAMFSADPEAARLFGATAIDETTGMSTIVPERAAEFFYGDCDSCDAEDATARLRAFPMQSLARVDAEPWRTIDSTYVVCAQDQAVPPSMQRAMAARARRVVDWPAGHSPFFSRPDLLVELLVPLLRPA